MRVCAIVLSFALGCAVQRSAALEVKLSSPMPEQLPYLYPDLTVLIVNESASNVLLPSGGLRVRVLLEHGNGWVECYAAGGSAHSVARITSESIEPGGTRAIPVPANRCICYGTRSTDMCREWADEPGVYRLKAVASTEMGEDSSSSSTLAGSFRGTLESPPIEFVVKQPTGLDAEAIAWAKGSPMGVDVLKTFPGSEYAALLWYGHARLDTANPIKVRSLIDRRLYPHQNSVPDPTSPNGWSSLDSEGVARWQILWGERVLREHPSFAYRDEVRVVVALSQLSLGMKAPTQKTLDALAANDRTAMGRWSKAFLAAAPPATQK
jgi:hypothetical protein